MEPTIIDKLEKSPEEMPVVSPTPTKKENKNLSAAVWLPLLMLFVLPIGAFLYFYLSGKIVFVDDKETENQQEEEQENEESAEEDETSEDKYTWTGTYLRGEMPEGWSFEEKDFELGGKELIFRNSEDSEQEYYLAPWYHSTCVKADNVQQLFEISFLDDTAYLMTADCKDTDSTVIGCKVYMEYPSTEEVRNLGTVAENGIRETTQYVFDTLNPEDESKTIDVLRAEYAPIKSILESIEIVEQEESDTVSTEGWNQFVNTALRVSILYPETFDESFSSQDSVQFFTNESDDATVSYFYNPEGIADTDTPSYIRTTDLSVEIEGNNYVAEGYLFEEGHPVDSANLETSDYWSLKRMHYKIRIDANTVVELAYTQEFIQDKETGAKTLQTGPTDEEIETLWTIVKSIKKL